jgi:hypothetical protein
MNPAEQVATPVTVRWGYADVFNRGPRTGEIKRLFRQLPRIPTLRRLAAYTVMLLRGRQPYDTRLQTALAYTLGGQSAIDAARLVQLLQSERSLFAWPEQLSSLSRYALTHCKGVQWPNDGNRRMFEALLAFNSQYNDELKVPWARTEDYEHFLPLEVPSSFLDEGNLSHILERFAQFVHWSRSSKEDDPIRCRVDLDSVMQDALGMSYDDYAAATLAFMSHFSGPTVDPDHIGEFEPILDVETFVSGVEEQGLMREWLTRNSVTMERARAILETSPKSTSIAAMYRLASTPLLQLKPGHTICPALPFLSNVVGTGLFYKLCDHLKETDGEKASGRLRGFFAEFLERHLRRLLTDATSATKARVFGEVTYAKGQKRSTDVIVVDGDTMLFFEVSAKRFHVQRSVLELDRGQIERDLRAMVVNKALELHKCVGAFKDGQFKLPGIENSAIKRFVGIVVTNQGFPRVIGCNQFIYGELNGKLKDLDAFDFIDIDEAEVLPRIYAGDLSLAELFAQKLNDPQFWWQSLTNFLYARQYDRLRVDEAKSASGIFFDTALDAAKKWRFRT